MEQSHARPFFPILAAIAISLPGLAFADADPLAQDRRPFADALMSRGMYSLAKPEYELLAKQKPLPKDIDVILGRLAECRRQTGDHKGAIAVCEHLEKYYPESENRFSGAITHALALEATGDKAKSTMILDSIATDSEAGDELRISALYFSAEMKFHANETAAAKMRFENLVAMVSSMNPPPKNRELADFASIYLAEAAAREGNGENALAEYDRMAKNQNPRIAAEALFKGAVASYSAKSYDAASRRFGELMKRFPEDARASDAVMPAAWSYFYSGKFTEAVALSDKILTGEKSTGEMKAEALYVKASSLASLMKRAESVGCFDMLIAQYPSSPFALSAKYERLVALFKDGQYERLLKEAELFSDPPGQVAADILWLQAESSEAIKDGARAAQFYRMIMTKHSKSKLAPDAAYRLATHLREGKSWLEASRVCLSLVASYPESDLVPYALFTSGSALLNLEKNEEALRDFDALASRHPGHEMVPEALLQASVALQNLGRTKEAGEYLDRLISANPGFKRIATAKFQKARILYETKDYPNAEVLLKSLISSNPGEETQRESSFLLGLVLEAAGRKSEAAAILQPLVKPPMSGKIPADRLVWLASFQLSESNFKEAVEAARAAAEREDISQDLLQSAYVMLGRGLLSMASTNEAAAAFKAAAGLPVKTAYTAEACIRLGEILLASEGDAAGAAACLEKAVQIASSPETASLRAQAYNLLAQAYEKSGSKDKAVRLYTALSLLYDDEKIVSGAMKSAARLLRESGKASEAEKIEADLKERYPKEASR